jgi:sRNA-binding regulator protein Hfq
MEILTNPTEKHIRRAEIQDHMASKGAKSKTRAPEQTFQEVTYLRHLIDKQVPVRIRLSNNEEVQGLVEFFDVNFIRVTRSGSPNLFLYKHDIKYLYEEPSRA